ncbi:MAG: anthranilate synthase component I family protein [Spirochaetales bacterium]|nr:anthranilate synthase component I family protein [Spirochaetales bacterium]
MPFETGLDFFEIFERLLKHCQTAFFLESLGEETYESRHSVIGFEPEHHIEARAGQFILDGSSRTCVNPYLELQKMMPGDHLSRLYTGGLVGYLGYEAMNFFEPSLLLKEHADFPCFEFGLYSDGLILDKLTGAVQYFYYNKNRLDFIQECLLKQPAEEPCNVHFTGFSRNQEEHSRMVQAAGEEILAGNTFQCQIGFKAHYTITGSDLPVYRELRRVNPSPHMFYIKFNDRRLIGASPELIFRLRQGEMETFPLAGTIERGKTSQEDRQLARKLLSDPKEIAEHNMLVDLHRNDLGRVARFGTVKVRRLFDLKRFSHVQHISSEVAGIIRRDHNMFSGLASVFPAGTLSGAPKIESMKIISRIENDPRGPYGGAVGHFGFNGDATFAIPIRTLFLSGNRAYSQASGGIVYDSHPEGEYREIQNKLAAMRQALRPFEKES